VVTVSGSQLTNNYAALTLLETATATISGSDFAGCSGSCLVTLDDSQATLSDNTFSDSPEANAIQAAENSKTQISGCTFTKVISAIVYMDSASGEASGNTLESFSSIGIMVKNSASPLITNNTLILGADNSAQTTIGILYQDAAATLPTIATGTSGNETSKEIECISS